MRCRAFAAIRTPYSVSVLKRVVSVVEIDSWIASKQGRTERKRRIWIDGLLRRRQYAGRISTNRLELPLVSLQIIPNDLHAVSFSCHGFARFCCALPSRCLCQVTHCCCSLVDRLHHSLWLNDPTRPREIFFSTGEALGCPAEDPDRTITSLVSMPRFQMDLGLMSSFVGTRQR